MDALTCECGKEAKNAAGLAAHKRSCNNQPVHTNEPVEPRPIIEEPTEEKRYMVQCNGAEAEVTDNGNHLRTFTQEIHGDSFADLARQFCDKMNSR